MVKFRDIRNRRTDWRREDETEVLTFYFFFLKFILIASLLGRSRVLICSTGSQRPVTVVWCLHTLSCSEAFKSSGNNPTTPRKKPTAAWAQTSKTASRLLYSSPSRWTRYHHYIYWLHWLQTMLFFFLKEKISNTPLNSCCTFFLMNTSKKNNSSSC